MYRKEMYDARGDQSGVTEGSLESRPPPPPADFAVATEE